VGAAVVSAAVVGAAVVSGAVVGGAVVGGSVVGGAVVGGSVVGGAVVGGSVVGGAVVGGAVVGGAVVGGAVVGGAVVGGVVPGGPVVGGGVEPGGGGGWGTPGGAGTPGTGSGPDGGVVSPLVIGLIDWIRPPIPVTTGKLAPPVGVGGSEEAADEPGGWPAPLPPPADPATGVGAGEVPLSAAPAMAPPKVVHPEPHDPPWSLRLKASSRPMRATIVTAQARARRRRDGLRLVTR
jgi:hypothetical protein